LNVAKPAVSPLSFDQPIPDEALALIKDQGLSFEPGFDDFVCLFDDEKIIACGARSGYVLKMIAISTAHQGTDLLGELVTKLLLSAISAGHDTVFVFTSPQNVTSFKALNFRLLTINGPVALMEHGPGLCSFISACAPKIVCGNNGSIIINGNPFTLGHQHLVEYAAKRVDQLYLFVVREDSSIFPFEARLYMAQKATSHLRNVTVLDTSRYAISAGTFPSYFLKKLDTAAENQMQTDLHLFAQHIAPAFHISYRFVGQEPFCKTTATYNEMMKKIFGAYKIVLLEIPRISVYGLPISATRVRSAFAANDNETLKLLVPSTTVEFLQSPSARTIAEQLLTKMEEV
jgi:[citrate (pro-3S)-lyase] ligase